MSKLLYINNQLVDLYPNTVIAQTLQAFTLGELGSVKANYTNQIRLPMSATNRRVLQFSDDSKSSSAFPYTSYSARYIENGIEVIRNGKVILRESDEDFMLNIFSGPIGFFDYIRTKKLWDLDTTDINTGWADSDRDAVRNATTGIVAPLLDDGIITYDAVTPAIVHTGSVTKHPWIYYHTVIDKIFEDAGYTKDGTIFSDDRYLKLAMPLRTIYDSPFLEAKSFQAAAGGAQVIVDPAAYTDIQFPTLLSEGEDGFYDGTSDYVVNNPDTALAYFPMTFRAVLTITVSGGTVDIIIARNNFPDVNVNLSGGTPVSAVGSGTYYLSTSGFANLKHSDNVSVRVIKNTGTPTVTITNGTFEGEVPKIHTLSSAYVYFNHLFEDINQVELIEDFSVRFNVLMTEKNGVIYCKTMDEVLANTANAKPWTMKRATKKNALQYAFGSLGRSNYFKYPTDEHSGELNDDYGKGVFTIANENIDESATVFEPIFNATDMAMYDERIFMAKISVGAGVESLGKRLCYLRQNVPASEPNSNVRYNVTARNDYKVAYFIDARQSNSMHWQVFLDEYYAGFVTKLQKAKQVTRDYFLTDVDIHTFDHFAPVFDNGEMFIVTQIKNYRSGKITEVELFKI